VAVTVSLLVSLAALSLGIVAFMRTVRDHNDIAGRLVQTRMTNEYAGSPVWFPLDDFFVGPDSHGDVRAFYAYPPGYFGHQRGCKMVWDQAATIAPDRGGSVAGPGLFIDPCGGARFNRDGILVSGPADRNLDEFLLTPAVDGFIVDTKALYCGAPLPAAPSAPATPESNAATVTATATVTPTATPGPQDQTCDRVSPNTKGS
jgi:hypothetical protein